MNWTGGRLCRSRNANSSTSAKQKNHFAKARAKLQSAQSSTPKRQPFDLGHWRPDYETKHVSSSSGQQYEHSQHQMVLDDFENVRPLVQKLQTLNQRNDSHKRKRPSLERCVHHPKREDSGLEPMSPIVISSRPSSASSAQSSAPAIATIEDPSRFDSLGTSGLTSIEAKRRRLLQMEDWVGVERRHSKPAHMTFTEAEDRDMIGKRRQMKKGHHVTRDAIHRSSKRPSYLGEPRQLDIASQDFGDGQMSIRIGSAVDRSQASVSSEEMLFDSEVQERNPRKLPAAPVVQHGELGSLPLSDRTHREIRDSSAFMDDLSSVAAIFQSEEMKPLPQSAHRRGDIDIPSGSMDDSTSFGFGCQPLQETPPKHKELGLPIDEEDDSEIDGVREASTPLELEPAQEEQCFRLVFENTPQPPASNWTDSDPIVRDFAYPNVGPPLARSNSSPLLRAQDVSIPDDGAETDDSSIESLASRPRFFGNAPNQNSGNHASDSRMQHTERSDNCGGERGSTANSESSQISKKEMRSPARRKSLDKDKLQPNLEEESIWRSFTMMDEMEDTKSFKARPTSNNNGKEPTANQHMDHNAQAFPPKTKPRSLVDDEEQIWRAFIFSDDDDNNPTNEWTLESPSPPIHSPTPSNPTRTQPSMIAEASTSPIKQNPHLHEASPTVSPSETSSQLKQGFSNRYDSATSHSSDVLAEVSSPTEDPLGSATAGTAQPETAEPSGAVSATAQRTKDFTFTPWTIPSLSEPDETQTSHSPHSSLSAQPPTTSSSSPSPPILSSSGNYKPVPHPSSSLIAAPPSTTYDTTFSSDELHGPSPGPVAVKLTSEHMKVVFTPPKRYIGPRAIDPEKTVALGRVLRSGKRAGGKVGGKAKGSGKGKGRGAADGEGEGYGDEIVDD